MRCVGILKVCGYVDGVWVCGYSDGVWDYMDVVRCPFMTFLSGSQWAP